MSSQHRAAIASVAGLLPAQLRGVRAQFQWGVVDGAEGGRIGGAFSDAATPGL